jgi:hypothetical protein
VNQGPRFDEPEGRKSRDTVPLRKQNYKHRVSVAMLVFVLQFSKEGHFFQSISVNWLFLGMSARGAASMFIQ